MFSTSALLSLASLSALASLVAASPLEVRQSSRPCANVQAGALCKLNGQDPTNSTSLTDTFSFDVRGKTGSNSAIDYLSLDFQPAKYFESSAPGDYLGEREFHVINYDVKSNSGKFPDFHYDNVKIPCGLSGKSYLNIVAHTSAGAGHYTSANEQRFGPFDVSSKAC